jgi:hypothetical protein
MTVMTRLVTLLCQFQLNDTVTVMTLNTCITNRWFRTEVSHDVEVMMSIVFDPLTAFPAEELVHLTVTLPQEVMEQIDDAVEMCKPLETRERFVSFAALYVLAAIRDDAAACWEAD